MKNNELIINKESNLEEINKSDLSYTFDTLEYKNIIFKNINFNLLNVFILRKLRTNTITIDNCVLGNLHYLEFNSVKEVYIKNQNIDSYIFSVLNVGYTHHLLLENNGLYSLDLLKNKHFRKLTIKNNNIKGQLDTLGNFYADEIYLEDLYNYTNNDLIFLSEKIKNKRLFHIFFDDKEINNKNLIFLQRKIKLQKLI